VGCSSVDISGGISIAEYPSPVCSVGNHHLAIYRSSSIHVRIVHDCCVARRIKHPFFFTEDALVCWLPLSIISSWNCVLHHKEIRSHVTYFTSSETDWARCRKSRLYRTSFGGWSTVCFLWPNKWRQCVNNIYHVEFFNYFSWCL